MGCNVGGPLRYYCMMKNKNQDFKVADGMVGNSCWWSDKSGIAPDTMARLVCSSGACCWSHADIDDMLLGVPSK